MFRSRYGFRTEELESAVTRKLLLKKCLPHRALHPWSPADHRLPARPRWSAWDIPGYPLRPWMVVSRPSPLSLTHSTVNCDRYIIISSTSVMDDWSKIAQSGNIISIVGFMYCLCVKLYGSQKYMYFSFQWTETSRSQNGVCIKS